MKKPRIKSGVAVIAALGMMFVLLSFGTGYAVIIRSQIDVVNNQKEALNAFYIAEAGAHEAIDRVFSDTSFSEDIPETSFSGGTYSVTLSGGQGELVEIASVGAFKGATRTVRTELLLFSPAGIGGALGISAVGGGDISFANSSGTITGVLLVKGSFTSGNMNMDDARQLDYFSDLPVITVDFQAYKQNADYKKVGGGPATPPYTFESGNTYTGVYYLNGDVNIQSNVTINGTIVSEGSVNMAGAANVNILAEGGTEVEGYPAIIARDNIQMDGMTNSNITGLVYAEDNIDINNVSNLTVRGGFIMGRNLNAASGTGLNLFYDLSLQPPDFNYTVNDANNSCVIKVISWKGYPGS